MRSRNHCAYPDCHTSLIERDGDAWLTVGERAHIRSDEPSGPRHDPDYVDPNTYENLILLCRRHHRLVDGQPALYPVELLETWKHSHESPVLDRLIVQNLPAPLTLNYIERPGLSAQIKASLVENNRAILVGPAGAGKTQLAAQLFAEEDTRYAYRFWVRCEDYLTALADLSGLGAMLNVRRIEGESSESYIGRIRLELEASFGWLLVLDDVQTDTPILDFLPRRGGHTVMTTRSAVDFSPIGEIHVAGMHRSESIRLLEACSGVSGADDLQRIAELGDDLPLCLMQLGGYLRASGLGLEAYLSLMETQVTGLLDRGTPRDHLSLRASIANLASILSPGAKEMMSALCFVGNSSFPLPSAEDWARLAGPAPSPFFSLTDWLAFEDALIELRRFSLVSCRDRVLSVHSTTQAVYRDGLSQFEDEQALFLAVSLVMLVLPELVDRHDHLEAAVALMPHVHSLLSHIGDNQLLLTIAATMLNRLAPAFGLAGDFDGEQAEFNRALALLDKLPDKGGEYRGSILQNLSNCHADHGDLEAAVSLAEEALTWKQIHGASNHSLGLSLGAIGAHLEETGRLEEAYEKHVAAASLVTPRGRPFIDTFIDRGRVLCRLERGV